MTQFQVTVEGSNGYILQRALFALGYEWRHYGGKKVVPIRDGCVIAAYHDGMMVLYGNDDSAFVLQCHFPVANANKIIREAIKKLAAERGEGPPIGAEDWARLQLGLPALSYDVPGFGRVPSKKAALEEAWKQTHAPRKTMWTVRREADESSVREMYPTYGEASRIAESLASSHPGTVYYVLEVVAAIEAYVPGIQSLPLERGE